jgi:hypothetical protein
MTVTWLLDVDGVLNARRHTWPDRIARRTISVDGESYPLAWSPTLVARVRELAADARVRIVWATSWCLHATHLEELWDLPTLARAWGVMHDSDAALAAAKRDAFAAAADTGRVIWTDDEHAPDTRTEAILGIRPHPKRGLGPADLDDIETFIGA